MTESTPAGSYRPVPTSIDLPAMEREILDFWETNGTFAASLDRTADGTPWTFYEGPPTANGMPGTHHIEARVFKDVFPRFKTMQGYRVDRKAGWDCHGLPVELAVEKELGFNGKPDIEAYGVEPFNAKCRESVSRHVGEFTELTRRMGYWVNLDEAYWTMSPDYVESVWWSLKQIHDKGLLVEDYRVAPYCPRCGTTLSDHELAQGYEDVSDPSVYVRFPLTSGPLAGKASLLVWTTTPWTLVSNTAAAVHPEVTYVVATKDEPGGESLVLAEALAEKVLGEGWLLGETFVGKDMEYWTYARPLELVEFPDVVGGTHYILLADYVTTEDGTGAVHEAPAFGEIDMEACRAYGLPLVNPVRPDGTFEEGLDLVGGMFFKDADQVIIDDLTTRGVMFKVEWHTHSYPHCWRCHTALRSAAVPRSMPGVVVFRDVFFISRPEGGLGSVVEIVEDIPENGFRVGEDVVTEEKRFDVGRFVDDVDAPAFVTQDVNGYRHPDGLEGVDDVGDIVNFSLFVIVEFFPVPLHVPADDHGLDVPVGLHVGDGRKNGWGFDNLDEDIAPVEISDAFRQAFGNLSESVPVVFDHEYFQNRKAHCGCPHRRSLGS
jgi:hypothetical protein